MREALHELRELKAERRERHTTKMDHAIRLRKTEKMKALPRDAAQIGFVCASAQTPAPLHPEELPRLPPHAPQ